MTWSAADYSTFEAERTRPVRDLVRNISRDRAKVVVDLGCGPGNSTEVLTERYPSASVIGIDTSPDMLDAARRRLPHVTFELADIADWQAPGAVDVILANASLQWLPDHRALYPALIAKLSAGGCLAVQTPDNLGEPSHRLARDVAADGPWSAKIGRVRHPDRHDATWYHALLAPLCAGVDIWRTTYFHRLQGHRAIVEWFRASALRPYLAPLSPGEQADFLAAYEQEISAAYPPLADGTVLLPFPRLFVIATR